MYLVIFSSFYKFKSKICNNDWDELYLLNCDVVLATASNLSQLIKKNFSGCKNNTFPICIHKFKDINELTKYLRLIKDIKEKIISLPGDNKRFTNYSVSDKNNIKVKRFLKISSARENNQTIVMEINSLTLLASSIVKEYLDKIIYNDKKNHLDLFRSIRLCDKHILKYIKPSKDNAGVYLLKLDPSDI